MTSNDIRNVTFEQARKGYRAEDVDDYLQQIAAELDTLTAERDNAMAELDELREGMASQHDEQLAAALAAKEDAEAKMYVLAEKVEEYRGQEDNLKNALINAQRMGETVVHEAKQKADQMLREATGQSELITQKAEREIARERATLEKIQGEVKQFKTTILNLYKQHIESLSALDPPTAKAQEVLDEHERYRGKEGEPEAAVAEEEAPVYGNAEPQLPDADDADAYVPLTAADYALAGADAQEAAAAGEAELPGDGDAEVPVEEGARFEPVLLGGEDLEDE